MSSAVPIMQVNPDVAAKFTLSPDVCLKQGTFPYFAEEVSGMFLRIKYNNAAASGLTSGDAAALLATQQSNDGLGASSTSAMLSPSSAAAADNNNTYLWTRIRKVVTAASVLAEMGNSTDEEMSCLSGDIDAHLNPSSSVDERDTNRWMSKVLNNPTYKWRGRVFEVYFLCEHPVFDHTINGEQKDRLVLVDLRLLAKNWQPTEMDIKAYTTGLTHPIGGVAVAAPMHVESGMDAADEGVPPPPPPPPVPDHICAKYTSVFLRYPISPSSQDQVPAILSDTAFPKSQQPVDAPKASQRRGFGPDALSHYLHNPAAVSGTAGAASTMNPLANAASATFPIGPSPSDVGAAWQVHLSRYVNARPLSPTDSKKLVLANSRLLNEAGGGNAVLGYTVVQNDLLYKKYLNEKKNKEQLGGTQSSSSQLSASSDDFEAIALRQAEEMTRSEMMLGGTSDFARNGTTTTTSSGQLPSQEEDPAFVDSEEKFFKYVQNPERNQTLDSLVHLSKRNFKSNSEKTVAGTAFFKLRVEKEGAYHIPAAGSVLWTVDREKREKMCGLDIDKWYKTWEAGETAKAKKEAQDAKRPLGYASDTRLDALIRARAESATVSSSPKSAASTTTVSTANDDDDDDTTDLMALARASSSGALKVSSSPSSPSPSSSQVSPSSRTALLVRSLSVVGLKRSRTDDVSSSQH